MELKNKQIRTIVMAAAIVGFFSAIAMQSVEASPIRYPFTDIPSIDGKQVLCKDLQKGDYVKLLDWMKRRRNPFSFDLVDPPAWAIDELVRYSDNVPLCFLKILTHK